MTALAWTTGRCHGKGEPFVYPTRCLREVPAGWMYCPAHSGGDDQRTPQPSSPAPRRTT